MSLQINLGGVGLQAGVQINSSLSLQIDLGGDGSASICGGGGCWVLWVAICITKPYYIHTHTHTLNIYWSGQVRQICESADLHPTQTIVKKIWQQFDWISFGRLVVGLVVVDMSTLIIGCWVRN